uniref:Protein sleepless n=1 Tax=Caenorhabditis japonica TaxID=281687 RepID=A0A8R1I8T6_CAEJA
MSRLVCSSPSAKPSVRLLWPSSPISSHATVLLVLLLAVMEGVSGIGCFVCSSFDGENKGCEDPFNSTMDLSSRDRDASAVANYNYPCWAYKKGRHGLFPADHCIKIVGYRADNESKTLVIRTCALDSGTLTADTEIVRISHCGSFKYEGHQYKGCVQSCDADGCNSSSIHWPLLPICLVLLTALGIVL